MRVQNSTIRGYLDVLAAMIDGTRPIGKDCRSTVARFLRNNPNTTGYICLVGDEGIPTHCLLVDPQGHKLADAYNGTVSKGMYHCVINGHPEVLEFLATIPTDRIVPAEIRSSMKIQAAQRLMANSTVDEGPLDAPNGMAADVDDTTEGLEDPLSTGEQFETLVDGEPDGEDTPEVQELTHDDGGVEEPSEQELLRDDLVPSTY